MAAPVATAADERDMSNVSKQAETCYLGLFEEARGTVSASLAKTIQQLSQVPTFAELHYNVYGCRLAVYDTV
jgi:hypothetical protein